jgi:anti-sigma regulatory factor (Ser/Thr protein kinase)
VTECFVLVVEPLPESVAVVRGTLGGWARQVDANVVETVMLLVSEVASNAVIHAGTAYRIEARWTPPIFRVEVTDAAPIPTRVPRRRGQIGGLGFEILDELSYAWGIDDHGDGTKAVWFEVEQPAA